MKERPPTYRLGSDFQPKLERFVGRFIAEGFEVFSEEFSRIDVFVEKAKKEPEDRDSHDLRITDKRKYLLELMAIGVYDEMNRPAFNRAADTLLIIPDCLSIHDTECEKAETKRGDVCRGCRSDCQANQIRQLAARYRIKSVFSKRKLSEQIEYYAGRSGSLSVVGIACVLMLAGGMRTAAEVGVPARGVPLNFCGCGHWNDEPFASEFDMSRLESILEEKYGPPG
ncbi:MAG: DUF116 domain-containing protein [candidate division Zixibacteria bacterium]|nr:DUF116 domain-containing protein [candidate division Zixibacteria bacterium]